MFRKINIKWKISFWFSIVVILFWFYYFSFIQQSFNNIGEIVIKVFVLFILCPAFVFVIPYYLWEYKIKS